MTTTSPLKKSLGWLISVLIAFHVLLAFGLPPAFPLGGTLVLAVIFWRIGAANALLSAFSILFATLAYGAALWITGLDQTIYARPHDVLTDYDYVHGHKAYKQNREVHMAVRQGDLQAMTSQQLPQEARPATGLFRTDSFGFRNTANYHGQPWVLVGDSYIAGISVNQEDLLADQLLRDYGIDVYALNHPGQPKDYLQYVEGLASRTGQPFKIMLFLFEGNDFIAKGERDSSMDAVGRDMKRGYKRYLRLFSDTNVYRFTSTLYKRYRHRDKVTTGEMVRQLQVGDKSAAFYDLYIKASEADPFEPNPKLLPQLEALGPWLGEIFFVPTKYRVYQRLVEPPADPLPHRRWEWLREMCEARKWTCTDLTPDLTVAAQAALQQGRMLYWRDDTHWNSEGIGVAARVVAAHLARRGASAQ